MIDAYLDESGIHDGAAVCVIAGYFGGRGQWGKFETLWRRSLGNFDVPLEKFHAKDLVNKAGFFWNWDREKHSAFLQEIITAIISYKVYPVSVGLLVFDFYSFSEPQRRFLTGARITDGKLTGTGNPNRAYFMPFQKCVKKILSYAEVGGKAHFFFGLDKPFAEYATAFFQDLLDHPHTQYHDRIGTLAFPLAKETPQLQAADLLVHLSYKDMVDRNETGGWGLPPPPLLNAVLQRARTLEDFHYYTKQNMQEGFEMTYRMSGNWDGH